MNPVYVNRTYASIHIRACPHAHPHTQTYTHSAAEQKSDKLLSTGFVSSECVRSVVLNLVYHEIASSFVYKLGRMRNCPGALNRVQQYIYIYIYIHTCIRTISLSLPIYIYIYTHICICIDRQIDISIDALNRVQPFWLET